MKLGILFSGGKDSTYAAYLARQSDHDISCLISIWSENQDSYMFHTPKIELTEKQAELMKIPFIRFETKGEKEIELDDLKAAIKYAVDKYGLQGIVTGAVESVYQATRVQKICNELGIECFNPLWQKDQLELLRDLIREGFDVRISAVAAHPLDESWIGRKIDLGFIEDTIKLKDRWGINPAGEGGEFESLVVNCPLYSGELEVEE